MEHMTLVLQHPAFQSNPFETMQEHLRNTLATQAQELKAKSQKRAKVEREEEEAKKKQKKERMQAAGGRHRKKFNATRTSKR